MDYIDPENFCARNGITTTTNQLRIVEHIAAASRRVDSVTGRQFGVHVGAATARYFRPASADFVVIDDCYEISTVEVDADDSGTYETTFATTDYETDPANGIGADGQAGWPAYLLRAIGGRWFPVPEWNRRRTVKITGKWGWAAVPSAVVEATYLLANRLYYEVSVPSGVTPSNADFGMPGSPLARPYTAEGLLAVFVRSDVAIGIAGLMSTTLAEVRDDLYAALNTIDAEVYRHRQQDFQYPALIVGWPTAMDVRPDMGVERDFVIDVHVACLVVDPESSDDLLSGLLEDAVEVLQVVASWDVRPVTDFREQILDDGRVVVWCRLPVAVFA